MKEIYEIPTVEEIKVQIEANIMSVGGDTPDIPGCDDNED